MSNYPDDIRNFDSHPSSPFYIDPRSDEEIDEEQREIERSKAFALSENLSGLLDDAYSTVFDIDAMECFAERLAALLADGRKMLGKEAPSDAMLAARVALATGGAR